MGHGRAGAKHTLRGVQTMIGSYPNMRSAVMAWATPTRVFIAGKRQDDFKTVETYYEKIVSLFRVPTSQALDMKPEGQRRWNTETIYADVALELKVDDIIVFECADGQKFRVMDKTDWNQFGYVEYSVVSDYR